ncbi:hypothetical protein M1373_02495 [Candidatus Marsarchaeota archaeon]|nr:hypothetical protein [Candidatus Marsarchaeota archaeon]MCL5404695.1 hypothetical protein [Candidatus Marsarchaeota archaeon]
MNNKIAQSATEYIVTYGWTILIIAIAISFLYLYIAVPHAIVPSSCSFLTGVTCDDMVLGTNATTHLTSIGVIMTNSRPYPILNPTFFASINGRNASAATCRPSFVLPGGSIICVLHLSNVTSSLGQYFSGDLYLNASYCGFAANSSSPSSCASVPRETYKGLYTARAEPATASNYSIKLTAATYNAPATNVPDQLTATVTLLGYPQEGATVNFTAAFLNGTPATPPDSLQYQYTTTSANGQAINYVSLNKSADINITASYLGAKSTIKINYLIIPKNVAYLGLCDGVKIVNPYFAAGISGWCYWSGGALQVWAQAGDSGWVYIVVQNEANKIDYVSLGSDNWCGPGWITNFTGPADLYNLTVHSGDGGGGCGSAIGILNETVGPDERVVPVGGGSSPPACNTITLQDTETGLSNVTITEACVWSGGDLTLYLENGWSPTVNGELIAENNGTVFINQTSNPSASPSTLQDMGTYYIPATPTNQRYGVVFKVGNYTSSESTYIPELELN